MSVSPTHRTEEITHNTNEQCVCSGHQSPQSPQSFEDGCHSGSGVLGQLMATHLSAATISSDRVASAWRRKILLQSNENAIRMNNQHRVVQRQCRRIVRWTPSMVVHHSRSHDSSTPGTARATFVSGFANLFFKVDFCCLFTWARQGTSLLWLSFGQGLAQRERERDFHSPALCAVAGEWRLLLSPRELDHHAAGRRPCCLWHGLSGKVVTRMGAGSKGSLSRK